MKNNRYTNLNSNLKRCGCTSIRYIKQGKTTRITAYKELSKRFDVVYGDKVDRK